MKPTKNRYFCVDAGRVKMLFDSEGAAKRFIQFNADAMNGKKPARSYYCIACGGWHLTSAPEKIPNFKSKVERYFENHKVIEDPIKEKK